MAEEFDGVERSRDYWDGLGSGLIFAVGLECDGVGDCGVIGGLELVGAHYEAAFGGGEPVVAGGDFGVGADAAVELGLEANGGQQGCFVPESQEWEGRFLGGFGVGQGVAEECEEVGVGGVGQGEAFAHLGEVGGQRESIKVAAKAEVGVNCLDLAEGVEVGSALGDMCRYVSQQVDVSAGSGGRSSCAARYAREEAEVWGEEDDDAIGLSEVASADDDAFGVEVSSSSWRHGGENTWIRF